MTLVFLVVFGLTALVIGAAMVAMAIGVIGSGRCLRGSCGGPGVRDAQGQRLSCADCPNRKENEAAKAKPVSG